MEWVMIVLVYVGIWGDTDSVALTNVPMISEAACHVAGEKLESLVKGTKKEVRYICVKNQ